MTSKILTQEYLKEIIHYDPDSGAFTWAKSKQKRILGGNAGYISNGYLMIGIDRKKYLAHRLAFLYMNGSLPSNQVDHINGVRDDNRWCNLRDVTFEVNMKNAKMPKNNKSGVAGVSWNKKSAKWQARICSEGRRIHIGVFASKSDAIAARKSAEVKHGFHPNHGRRA